MTHTKSTKAIAALRSTIGGASWVMPLVAGRLFGLRLRNEENAPLLLRMGGTRDFALAAGALDGDRDARTRALRLGQACDLGDIAATVIATRQGRMSPLAATLFVSASGACIALGSAALADARRGA